jgi:hypothetical protein
LFISPPCGECYELASLNSVSFCDEVHCSSFVLRNEDCAAISKAFTALETLSLGVIPITDVGTHISLLFLSSASF